MPYFDLTQNGALLKSAAREHPDIESIVSQAEFDVINFYTDIQPNHTNTPLQGYSRLHSGLENLTLNSGTTTVYLTYYKSDPALLVTAEELTFKTAMQRAIAATVEERIAQEDRQPGVKSESRGRRSVSYFQDVSPAFSIPASARSYLRKYDVRPPV